MSKSRILMGAFLASAAIVGMQVSASAADDDYVAQAKDYIAKATAPVNEWAGPTTGPKAVEGKRLIVYVSADQRNGGAQGVADGAAEAAGVLGWDFRILDGQGTVPGRTSAMTQAIALQPDGIILGSPDSVEQAPTIEQAVAQGIKVIGWHSGPTPGKIEGSPIFTNITSDPIEVAKASALYAVADSNGTANAILFTDSIYAIAIAKSDAARAAIEACSGCKVLSTEDTPIGDLSNRMGQLTTSLLAKYGSEWTYSIAVNDLYFDFSAPSLVTAGVDPAEGYPRQISAGDGSVPAFQRIRDGQYQVATVAEPLNQQGWQTIDEMNRALAGEDPSGFVQPPHLFIKANVDQDGGENNIFDPGNNYREEYKKIWGVQ